jgi:hypothetical protein
MLVDNPAPQQYRLERKALMEAVGVVRLDGEVQQEPVNYLLAGLAAGAEAAFDNMPGKFPDPRDPYSAFLHRLGQPGALYARQLQRKLPRSIQTYCLPEAFLFSKLLPNM